MELWRLYDSENKVFFNNLNVTQLYKIIDAIPEKEIKFWHICKDGEEDWFPLAERLDEVSKGEKSRATGVMSLKEFLDDSENSGSFLKSDLKEIEKRKVKRVETKIKVFIDVGETILEAETKDISLFAIKLDRRFPMRYKGKYYPLTLRSKPPLTLRCTPMVSEKEHIRGTWSIVTVDPNFNLSLLAMFLKVEDPKKEKL